MFSSFISLALSLCLVFSTLSPAQAVGARLSLQDRFSPPTKMGYVTEAYEVPGRPLVVLIQDFHINFDAQKNIARLLEFLSVKLASEHRSFGASAQAVSPMPRRTDAPALLFALAVEGAEGAIPTLMLNTVGGVRAVGDVTTPTTRTTPTPLTPSLKREVLEYLMREGEITGMEYFAAMREIPNYLVGVEDKRYYNAHRDLFRKTLASRQELVERLRGFQADLELLATKTYSKELMRLRKESANWYTPKEKVEGYLRAMELVKTPEEKKLWQVEHDLDLLLRMVSLQATETEVRAFAPRVEQFLRMTEVLVESSRRGGVEAKSDAPTTPRLHDSTSLKELLASSIDYYVLAMARNEPMVERTLALLDNNKNVRDVRAVGDVTSQTTRTPLTPSTVVLVAGGFHTAPITELLRKRGISYAVLTPRVDHIPESDHALYVKRLLGERLTLEEAAAAGDRAAHQRGYERLLEKWRLRRDALAAGFSPVQSLQEIAAEFLRHRAGGPSVAISRRLARESRRGSLRGGVRQPTNRAKRAGDSLNSRAIIHVTKAAQMPTETGTSIVLAGRSYVVMGRFQHTVKLIDNRGKVWFFRGFQGNKNPSLQRLMRSIKSNDVLASYLPQLMSGDDFVLTAEVQGTELRQFLQNSDRLVVHEIGRQVVDLHRQFSAQSLHFFDYKEENFRVVVQNAKPQLILIDIGQDGFLDAVLTDEKHGEMLAEIYSQCSPSQRFQSLTFLRGHFSGPHPFIETGPTEGATGKLSVRQFIKVLTGGIGALLAGQGRAQEPMSVQESDALIRQLDDGHVDKRRAARAMLRQQIRRGRQSPEGQIYQSSLLERLLDIRFNRHSPQFDGPHGAKAAVVLQSEVDLPRARVMSHQLFADRYSNAQRVFEQSLIALHSRVPLHPDPSNDFFEQWVNASRTLLQDLADPSPKNAPVPRSDAEHAAQLIATLVMLQKSFHLWSSDAIFRAELGRVLEESEIDASYAVPTWEYKAGPRSQGEVMGRFGAIFIHAHEVARGWIYSNSVVLKNSNTLSQKAIDEFGADVTALALMESQGATRQEMQAIFNNPAMCVTCSAANGEILEDEKPRARLMTALQSSTPLSWSRVRSAFAQALPTLRGDVDAERFVETILAAGHPQTADRAPIKTPASLIYGIRYAEGILAFGEDAVTAQRAAVHWGRSWWGYKGERVLGVVIGLLSFLIPSLGWAPLLFGGLHAIPTAIIAYKQTRARPTASHVWRPISVVAPYGFPALASHVFSQVLHTPIELSLPAIAVMMVLATLLGKVAQRHKRMDEESLINSRNPASLEFWRAIQAGDFANAVARGKRGMWEEIGFGVLLGTLSVATIVGAVPYVWLLPVAFFGMALFYAGKHWTLMDQVKPESGLSPPRAWGKFKQAAVLSFYALPGLALPVLEQIVPDWPIESLVPVAILTVFAAAANHWRYDTKTFKHFEKTSFSSASSGGSPASLMYWIVLGLTHDPTKAAVWAQSRWVGYPAETLVGRVGGVVLAIFHPSWAAIAIAFAGLHILLEIAIASGATRAPPQARAIARQALSGWFPQVVSLALYSIPALVSHFVGLPLLPMENFGWILLFTFPALFFLELIAYFHREMDKQAIASYRLTKVHKTFQDRIRWQSREKRDSGEALYERIDGTLMQVMRSKALRPGDLFHIVQGEDFPILLLPEIDLPEPHAIIHQWIRATNEKMADHGFEKAMWLTKAQLMTTPEMRHFVLQTEMEMLSHYAVKDVNDFISRNLDLRRTILPWMADLHPEEFGNLRSYADIAIGGAKRLAAAMQLREQLSVSRPQIGRAALNIESNSRDQEDVKMMMSKWLADAAYQLGSLMVASTAVRAPWVTERSRVQAERFRELSEANDLVSNPERVINVHAFSHGDKQIAFVLQLKPADENTPLDDPSLSRVVVPPALIGSPFERALRDGAWDSTGFDPTRKLGGVAGTQQKPSGTRPSPGSLAYLYTLWKALRDGVPETEAIARAEKAGRSWAGGYPLERLVLSIVGFFSLFNPALGIIPLMYAMLHLPFLDGIHTLRDRAPALNLWTPFGILVPYGFPALLHVADAQLNPVIHHDITLGIILSIVVSLLGLIRLARRHGRLDEAVFDLLRPSHSNDPANITPMQSTTVTVSSVISVLLSNISQHATRMHAELLSIPKTEESSGAGTANFLWSLVCLPAAYSLIHLFSPAARAAGPFDQEIERFRSLPGSWAGSITGFLIPVLLLTAIIFVFAYFMTDTRGSEQASALRDSSEEAPERQRKLVSWPERSSMGALHTAVGPVESAHLSNIEPVAAPVDPLNVEREDSSLKVLQSILAMDNSTRETAQIGLVDPNSYETLIAEIRGMVEREQNSLHALPPTEAGQAKAKRIYELIAEMEMSIHRLATERPQVAAVWAARKGQRLVGIHLLSQKARKATHYAETALVGSYFIESASQGEKISTNLIKEAFGWMRSNHKLIYAAEIREDNLASQKALAAAASAIGITPKPGPLRQEANVSKRWHEVWLRPNRMQPISVPAPRGESSTQIGDRVGFGPRRLGMRPGDEPEAIQVRSSSRRRSDVDADIKILQEGLAELGEDDVRIIFFGSRARGEGREDSDFDYQFVITPLVEQMSKSERLAYLESHSAMMKNYLIRKGLFPHKIMLDLTSVQNAIQRRRDGHFYDKDQFVWVLGPDSIERFDLDIAPNETALRSHGKKELFEQLTNDKFVKSFISWWKATYPQIELTIFQLEEIHRFAKLIGPATGKDPSDPQATLSDIRNYLEGRSSFPRNSFTGAPYVAALLAHHGFPRRLHAKNQNGKTIQYVDLRLAGEPLIIDLVADGLSGHPMGVMVIPQAVADKNNLPWYSIWAESEMDQEATPGHPVAEEADRPNGWTEIEEDSATVHQEPNRQNLTAGEALSALRIWRMGRILRISWKNRFRDAPAGWAERPGVARMLRYLEQKTGAGWKVIGAPSRVWNIPAADTDFANHIVRANVQAEGTDYVYQLAFEMARVELQRLYGEPVGIWGRYKRTLAAFRMAEEELTKAAQQVQSDVDDIDTAMAKFRLTDWTNVTIAQWASETLVGLLKTGEIKDKQELDRLIFTRKSFLRNA